MEKLYSLAEIASIRPSLHNVVLIGGVFDILHSGHIDHLREAKAYGETLIVHVTSDERVRQKKGPARPINAQNDRAKLIAAIRYVDYVFIDSVPHYDPKILTAVKPDILLLNYEAVSPQIKNYLSTINPTIRVVVSDAPKVTSTTAIIAKSSQIAATSV